VTEINLQKTKSNLAWISVLVVFLGAIVYVPMVELSEKREEVVYYRIPVIVPTFVNQNIDENGEVISESEKESTDLAPKTLLIKDLKLGDVDPEVKILQQLLNSRGFIISESGPGSPGNETELFGKNTKDALIKFQEANSEILLKPFGLTNGTGFLGELTRKLLNS
jgi:hypothetical protein